MRDELMKKTGFAEMDKIDFLAEIIAPKHEYKYNKRLERDIRHGSLSFSESDFESLFTHYDRTCNDNTLKQESREDGMAVSSDKVALATPISLQELG